MVWLGILLAPFGSGKTTHREFFSSYLPGDKARVLSVDDYVYRHPLYRKALKQGRRETLRPTYLKLVRQAQEQYDKDLDFVITEGAANLVLEESGRSSRWAGWFEANTLKAARKFGYNIALFYLAVGPREAYTRCQQRKRVPFIPKADFDACRETAAGSFVALAPLVDQATVFLANDPLPSPPALFCTLSPAPKAVGSYADLEKVLALRSSTLQSRMSQLLSPCFPLKGAWATLVMGGDRYVPGALVLGHSLRLVRTKFDTICMVTKEVSPQATAQLKRVFTHVHPVERLSVPSRPMRGKKQQTLYSEEFVTTIFTKWSCLTFTEYDKVVCVDADIAFQQNADDLFNLPTPAGTFDNPWYGGSREGWYGRLTHGDRVPSDTIRAAYKDWKGYVVFGSLVMLSPSLEDFQRLTEMLTSHTPYGKGIRATNGPDEIAITELYVPRAGEPKRGWTHIDPRYHLIPWKTYSPPLGKICPGEARALHYFGKEKPWEMERGSWDDLKSWWRVWDSLQKELGLVCLCSFS